MPDKLPDNLRTLFNILLFCATVVAMFVFILYVADEVKNPDAPVVQRPEADHDVICREEPQFNCRAASRIEESWVHLAEKADEVRESGGEWKPGFADTLALYNAEVDYLALYNARQDDYRLIVLDGDTPVLGVYCTGEVPAYKFGFVYDFSDFSDAGVAGIRALEKFAERYNRIIALQPEYPHAELCTPVFHYSDYQAAGEPAAPGSFDERTFFMAPEALLPAIRENRTKKQPE